MRKIFRSLLVLVFGVFLISSINVKATSPLVEAIDGASIRTQGVQGLRFYARLDESMKANEHGFYLIYGEATVQQLTDAITTAAGGQILLNDKEVFKVEVPGVTDQNEFSVVLTGIPDTGYLDKITVIPYVENNDLIETLSIAPVTRSVGEVAIAMEEEGLETPPEGIIDLLSIVSFDLNYDGIVPSDVIVYRNSVVNKPADPIREGYKFLGWFKEVSLTTEWNFAADVVAEYKMPLYAKWVILPSVETTVMAQVVIAGNPQNMVENINYATHSDLNPEIFTVNGIKGAAGQGVGLYSGAFRLYSVRASGEGNTLKISIAAGYEITKIKINYASSGDVTTADLDLGGTVQNISALKDESQDYNDLAISYFSIKNTHQGGSKNLQIHIASIEITYLEGELTDEQKVALDLTELSLPEQVIEAGTFNLPTEGSRGSTITWTVASGDSSLIDLLTGVYTMPEATENLTLKATVSFGVASAEKAFTILFHVAPQTGEQTFVEDFENSTAGSSYGDGSFVGVNGITWSYVASRDDNGDANASGIVAPAIMLRRASDNSAISSSTISGGISSFSVKLYKGFTGGGDRQVELFINGISYGTSTAFDDFNEHVFTVNNINVAGDFTIEVRNITSKQVIIDDITWTTYTT